MRTIGREEAGVTLVETLVAAIILVVGLLGVLQVFDTSTRNTFRAEERQVAINVAQRELEEIRNLDYKAVALTSVPSGSDAQNDPRSRVSGTRFDVNDDGSFPPAEEMVINGGPLHDGGQVSGGVVSPEPEPFESGDISGHVFRFVVWRDDPDCDLCPGGQDLKRVVVAVKLDTAPISYERPYIEVQSDFTDPEESVLSDPPDPGGEDVVGQQFWLSDTTCNHTARQDIVLDPPGSDGHPLHNTLGTCADGRQTGTTPGAPDGLIRNQPPDPTPLDPNDPPLYDYANDLEPTGVPPDSDKGLQLVRQDAAGCDFDGGGGDAQQKIHRWVTAPMPTDFQLEGGTGGATLELYTRTLGEAIHPGKVCVYLFTREEVESGGTVVATDIPILLTGARTTSRPDEVWQCGLVEPNVTCSTATWPADRWARVRITLDFTAVPVAVNKRLGVGISVERDGTSGEVLQFAYDHPTHTARLEVDTTTPLDE
jgi:type II secretory pathway pseudopilin PulG